MISVIINSKIGTGWGSTGYLSMKLKDTHVNLVIKKQKKSLISSSLIKRLMKRIDISAFSTMKKSHPNVYKITQRSIP